MKVLIILVTLLAYAQCRVGLVGTVMEEEAKVVTCELCQMIMGLLENMLQGNTTVAAIESALDRVCSDVPASYYDDCDAFVETYREEIVKLMVAELADPVVMCKELGLCLSFSSPKCDTCQTLSQYFYSLLEESFPAQEIKKMLANAICNFLPDDVQGECEDIVKLYGPDVIKLFAQSADPKKLVPALKPCRN